MEVKKVHVFDGGVRDKSDNRISDHFLHVNSCGVNVDSYMNVIRPNGRSDYQLLYAESGIIELLRNGTHHTVPTGGFILYRPGEAQNYLQKKGKYYWVHFSGSVAEELLRTAGLGEGFYFLGRSVEPSVIRAFERLIYHYPHRSPQRELALAADLITLVTELGRIAQNEPPIFGDTRLRPVILSMNRNFKKEINLDAYAAEIGLSRSRFLHLFKEATGKSPYAYVLELRLHRAAELLISSAEPISQIAFSVGFSDPLYFSRLFKKHFGKSPEAFRKQ